MLPHVSSSSSPPSPRAAHYQLSATAGENIRAVRSRPIISTAHLRWRNQIRALGTHARTQRRGRGFLGRRRRAPSTPTPPPHHRKFSSTVARLKTLARPPNRSHCRRSPTAPSAKTAANEKSTSNNKKKEAANSNNMQQKQQQLYQQRQHQQQQAFRVPRLLKPTANHSQGIAQTTRWNPASSPTSPFPPVDRGTGETPTSNTLYCWAPRALAPYNPRPAPLSSTLPLPPYAGER